MSQKFLDESARPKVTAAIKEAEAGTAGQIVPVILRASRSYHAEKTQLILEGILLALFLVVFDAQIHPGVHEPVTPALLFLVVAGGALLGWVLGFIPFILRLTIGRKELQHSAHEKALASFVKFGLTETTKRTGVLVFISLFERHVEILGDRGIHAKVADDFWKSQCDQMVNSIQSGNAIDGLCATIRAIAKPLTDFFPRESNDTDELPNDLITEDR